MKKIPRALYDSFDGQFEARVLAFRQALAAAALDVAAPAPVEDAVVEDFARDNDTEFEIEELPPTPPLPPLPELAPPVPVGDHTWTPLQFKEEFTQAERVKMRRFAKQDELAEDFLDLLNASTAVDPSDERVLAGLQYFVAKGVLAQNRVTEIIANKLGGENA